MKVIITGKHIGNREIISSKTPDSNSVVTVFANTPLAAAAVSPICTPPNNEKSY